MILSQIDNPMTEHGPRSVIGFLAAKQQIIDVGARADVSVDLI